MFNDEGVRYIHGHVSPLAVNTMDDAQKVIANELQRGPSKSTTPEQWARHLVWVIGFDRLIEDRNAIRKITSLVVK